MMTDAIMVNGLCMALFGIWTIGGYLCPVDSFGRWVAPYTLAGTISLLLPIIAVGLAHALVNQ